MAINSPSVSTSLLKFRRGWDMSNRTWKQERRYPCPAGSIITDVSTIDLHSGLLAEITRYSREQGYLIKSETFRSGVPKKPYIRRQHWESPRIFIYTHISRLLRASTRLRFSFHAYAPSCVRTGSRVYVWAFVYIYDVFVLVY